MNGSLARLGWTDEVLSRIFSARLWTPRAIGRLGLRYDAASGVVGIPVRDASGDELGRISYLPFAEQRNDRPKMQQPAGVPRQLFPPPETISNDASKVVITEGEPDAVAAIAAGFHAVAIPGTQGWKEDEHPARFTGRRWTAYMVLDCDQGGRAAAAKVAVSLIQAGVNCRVVDLDPGRDDGYDLTDFLRERGREALQGRLDAAEPYVPPGLADLLDELADYIRHYVVLRVEQAETVALWIAHAEVIEAFDTTPYLYVFSPMPRSGKSRLLEVIEVLVARPLATTNISDAALFRAITAERPTLLFDEIDATFGPKARDREDLRGLLDAGWRRGGLVRRMGGAQKTTLEAFEVFCPKVLAGIGRLPTTITDRAIPIEMKRKVPGETVARFRRREAKQSAEPLRLGLEAWAEESLDQLRDARPKLPDALDDRAQDFWEPLLAIADLAGGTWPERARQAALALSTGDEREDDSLGVRLLADCRTAFEGQERLPTAELIRVLVEDEEAPWADWRDRGQLSPRELARLLKPYGITSRTIRLDAGTPKGYHREQFEDAWTRYLPVPGPSIRHNATTRMDTGVAAYPDPPQPDPCGGWKSGANRHGYSDVALWRQEGWDTGAGSEAKAREPTLNEAQASASPTAAPPPTGTAKSEQTYCRECRSHFCPHVAPHLYGDDGSWK